MTSATKIITGKQANIGGKVDQVVGIGEVEVVAILNL